MSPLRIALVGPDGRMGRVLARAISEREGFELAQEVRRGEQPDRARCDVAVDFTGAAASAALAEAAAGAGGPALVIGSTGFDLAQEDAIRQAAERIAIVKAGN